MTEENIFTLKNPKSIVSEAFRTLRTNIQFANIDKNIKVIVITSSNPNEGKSTVSSNLCVSIAQTDKKVLLIDCDMRKPRIHKNFGLTNINGLTSILMGEKSLSEVEHKAFSDYESLTVVTSGPIPPNPAELLGSTRMKEFLEGIREQFDMIILDSPPINLVTDSAILSTIADGTILVLEGGRTHIDSAKNAKELLDKVHANLIGVILNKIPTKGRSSYSYGYYQYAEYYDDEDINVNKKKKRRSK